MPMITDSLNNAAVCSYWHIKLQEEETIEQKSVEPIGSERQEEVQGLCDIGYSANILEVIVRIGKSVHLQRHFLQNVRLFLK